MKGPILVYRIIGLNAFVRSQTRLGEKRYERIF